jgi:hypothetical protein
MNYILWVDIVQPFAELFDYLPYRQATKLFSVNYILKWSPLYELRNDVNLWSRLTMVDEANHISMSKPL